MWIEMYPSELLHPIKLYTSELLHFIKFAC